MSNDIFDAYDLVTFIDSCPVIGGECVDPSDDRLRLDWPGFEELQEISAEEAGTIYPYYEEHAGRCFIYLSDGVIV